MHPRIVAKLRAEFTSANISSPIKDSEARNLPYLQAVIKEGLRVFPPIPGLLSKEVPPEGDTINGKFVPGGTKIGWGIFGVCRDKAIWGEDSDLFRPERWLEASAEKYKEMDSTLDLVFGYGRYQCLGKNLAFMELNKIFVEVSFESRVCGCELLMVEEIAPSTLRFQRCQSTESGQIGLSWYFLPVGDVVDGIRKRARIPTSQL
jgi:cytochrome P450